MRIISGIHKGKRIRTKLPTGIRPTTDRVKETAFNILTNLIDLDSIKVLDLFAGTGLLGLEAISRGAARCTSVEKSSKTASFIKHNATSLGISELDVITLDAIRFLRNTNDSYDLIIADPPYNLYVLDEVLSIITDRALLRDDGIIMLEVTGGSSVSVPEGLNQINRRDFGDSSILFIERE